MQARDLWVRIELLHAVTYFGAEFRPAAKAAGLKGFWMGYFGFRAAPMGAVGAGVVDATFANFAPPMVQRAIPDAWDHADPADLVLVRAATAAASLRRCVPDIDAAAATLAPLLRSVAGAGSPLGLPLYAANRAVASFDDPVADLWQHCTTLREHRGDGHVAALAAAGIDGCQAHVLISAEQGTPPEILFDNRGWTPDEQQRARDRLVQRGLLAADGLTAEGRTLRAEIEATTDRLAQVPFDDALSASEQDELLNALTPIAQAVQAEGEIPFPNPMGLPRL